MKPPFVEAFLIQKCGPWPPVLSGHFDPDRHGLLPRANGELAGRRQRGAALPPGAPDVLVQHSGGPVGNMGDSMVVDWVNSCAYNH